MNRTIASLVVVFCVGLFCSAVAHAEAPYNVAWSRQSGTNEDDDANGVAVDFAGNVYITGQILDRPNDGSSDAFLAKYDAAGNLVWSRQIGTTTYDESSSVAVDTAGNAYISGVTFGSLGGPNAGNGDAFLSKYDVGGNLVWSRQIGTATYDASEGVAVDAIGNAYISGGTLGGIGGPNAGNFDEFLTKYDSAGNLLWSRQLGTTSGDASEGVAVDAAGNAYTSGYSAGSLGGPNAGNSDAVLTKYDSTGNLIWSRQFGSDAYDISLGVAVDAAGNAYLSGSTLGSLAGPNAGYFDAFLTKYDAAGNLVWSRQIGTTGADDSFDVAVDAAGNAYISGDVQGSLGGPYAGGLDAYLTKYDGAGNVLWSRQIGTTAYDVSKGVAVDAAGHAYISGFTEGSLGGPSAGKRDAFVVKFAVPEPSTLMLFVIAVLGLSAWRSVKVS